MKKLLLIALLSSSVFADKIEVHARAKRAICVANAYCVISGVHDIEIINDNNFTKIYSYSYILCPDDQECYSRYNTIEVAPYSKWNNHHDSKTTVKYHITGSRGVVAKTTVTFANVTNEQSDSNKIWINK